ncbi:hypothetical protein MKW98_025134 [Papaver atlanticum]|uniref:Uncharacterized protein n=1 Tax=Papaver atlanticum TaxID=357466 RepID=A0AAD4S1U8_9MAGN|nr:hypothetical protein MKW98_025134 [Papaver atlanticum]
MYHQNLDVKLFNKWTSDDFQVGGDISLVKTQKIYGREGSDTPETKKTGKEIWGLSTEFNNRYERTGNLGLINQNPTFVAQKAK